MLRLSCMVSSMALSLAILTGCGGGGGDSTPVAAVPLSSANFAAVTGKVMSNVVLGNASTGLVTSANATSDTGTVLPLTVDPVALSRFARTQIEAWGAARKVQSQATQTEVSSCAYGGSLQVTYDDADNNSLVSRGDSLIVVASACQLESDGVPVTGALRLLLAQVSDTALSGTLDFVNLSADGVSMNGSATIRITDASVVVDYNGLAVTEGGTSRVLDYVITVYSDGATTVVGPVTLDGSTYTLATPVPMTFGSTYPDGGTLRVTDGHGNRVDAVLSPTGYAASLYLKGDDVVDMVVTVLW